MSHEMICSECSGIVKIVETKDGKLYKCMNCGKSKTIKEKKEIDMSNEEVLYG